MAVLISGNSIADSKLNPQVSQIGYEVPRLNVPKLYVTLKSQPRLAHINLISSVASNTATTNDMVQTVHASLISSDELNKLTTASLYKKYGFNQAVENSLHFYTKKFKQKFLTQLGRTGKYLSKILEIFNERELPHELAFLPLIESGFNWQAYSPKKASGLWQFIPGTAKKYGLKIDSWVDERRDPIKATIAASEYLSDLYEMFGSWNLALAAYNAGEGTIFRAMDRTKKTDFWALRETKYIKKETKNYIPAYIAATAIAMNPEDFGFENVAYHAPIEYDEVDISSPMNLKTIAKFTGVEIEEIKELNPELKKSCTPPNVKDYTLKIPAGTKEKFLSCLLTADKDVLPQFHDEHNYTVKKGDTVSRIARHFGVSSKSIIKM
ncbi:MAG: transglycosylase SLT domain-containing protein, partial [Nitrospirae bacterium]|nr:transglycosylase SLT domain-containing protein [Nitrospirota bacterium]